ncbi:MAG: ester cyclase [Chloroflexi bacterium]|nr:ester cyclase [Chloroflexota bacterium]
MSRFENSEAFLVDENYWYELWEGRQAGIAGEYSSEQEKGRVAREWYECINSHAVGCIARHLAESAEFVDVAGGITMRGSQRIADYFQRWFDAFSDYSVEIKNLAVAGDLVTVEYDAEGTERGALRGPSRQIAPVGHRFELHCCDVLQIRDGKLAICRSYYDKATMMNQLGLGPVELAA